MPIRISCPSCGSIYAVDEQVVGRSVKCAACSASFTAVKSGSPTEIQAASSPAAGPTSPAAAPSSPVAAPTASLTRLRMAKPLPETPPAAPVASTPAPVAVPISAAAATAPLDPIAPGPPGGDISIKTGRQSTARSRRRRSSAGASDSDRRNVWVFAGGGIVLCLLAGFATFSIVVKTFPDTDDDEPFAALPAPSDIKSPPAREDKAGTVTDESAGSEDSRDFVIERILTENGLAFGVPGGAHGANRPLAEGKAGLVIDWPEAARVGSALTINGQPSSFMIRGPTKFHFDPGAYEVEVSRFGDTIATQSVELTAGNFATIKPKIDADQLATKNQLDEHNVGGQLGRWLQDVEAAKRQAASDSKDIMVVFMGSDWCGWSIRLSIEVLFTDAFCRRVGEKFVFVLVDFPRDEQARRRVQDAERNRALSRPFGIEGYPTLVFADSQGRPYGRIHYVEGGGSAFLGIAGKQQLAKGQRDKLFAKVDSERYLQQLRAALTAIRWLQKKKVLQHYGSNVRSWHELAKKGDPDNIYSMLEAFFSADWLVRLAAAEREDRTTLLALVEELTAWTKQHQFSDGNRGGYLHLAAGMVLSKFDESTKALEHIRAGLACKPEDPTLRADLESQVVLGPDPAAEPVLEPVADPGPDPANDPESDPADPGIEPVANPASEPESEMEPESN